MSYCRTDYRKNNTRGMKSTVIMPGVKKPKLTTEMEKNKSVIGGMQGGVLRESSHHEADNKKLRESVLNKLWDSLPPETQILNYSGDEDSDSTQSGLDDVESDDEENPAEFPNNQLYREKSIEKSEISWDVNLDFIQSIIWLKSTAGKLQRVPADEFFNAFQNQWELSQEIKSTRNRPLEIYGSLFSLKKTKQRDKIDLIRRRLAIHDRFTQNQEDIVISETDESKAPSLQSSQCVPERSAINTTAVLDSIENSTIDSGFGSEKPESVETVNSALGVKDRAKSFGESGKKIGKRKRNAVFRTDLRTAIPKKSRLSISSATLNCVLRSSECNKVLLDSVRVILRVLEDEKNGFYNLGSDWDGSVQKEAIEAVVGIVDQLEKEKGSYSCRNEVVAMVKRVLEKMLQSSEVDKAEFWEHQRLVILELCNASSVCKEVVNYLISELKNLIPVPIQTTEKNMRQSVVVMDKSYILLQSLKVALNKYKSFASTFVTVEERNASPKVPEVTDLWKRHWKVMETDPDVFVTGLERLEIPEDPKEVWSRVLEELVVVSTTIWPLVKILAWQCLAVLK